MELDQVESATQWFDELERREHAITARREEEEQMTQQQLQEATDDFHDTH